MRTLPLAFFTVCFLVASAFAAPSLAQQQSQLAANQIIVPRLIRFSGTLRDASESFRGGVTGITFGLYKEQQGGPVLWIETQSIPVDSSGHYTVLLGATKPEGVPIELFASGEARWLGVAANGQAEQPRVLLLSVPYALKAADAETLGGKPASAFALSESQLVSGSAQAGAAGVRRTAQPQSSASSSAIGGSGTTDFLPLWTGSTTLGNSALFQIGGNIGLGTKTPGAKLDITTAGTIGVRGITSSTVGDGLQGIASATSGVNFGVQGFSSSPSGVGVQGKSPGTGVAGFSSGTSGNGVFGQSNATSGVNFGVQGISNSPKGGGVQGKSPGSGLVGFSSGTSGNGVFGESTATSGITFGVQGIDNSPSGVGVQGLNNSTTGPANGIFGQTASSGDGAAGVVGTATPATGHNFGVVGRTASTTAGASGVNGFASATSGVIYGTSGGTASTTNGAAGVSGIAFATTGAVLGVSGQTASTSGIGVSGSASAATGVTCGVCGQTNSTTNNASGVNGFASGKTGVVFGVAGNTSSTNGIGTSGSASALTGVAIGVSGGSASTSGIGVFGAANATSGNTIGVHGRISSPNGAAGQFWATNGTGLILQGISGAAFAQVFSVDASGNVTAKGNLKVSGTKSSVARLADGREVALYAVESPENWFEDFGTARLQHGRTVVLIDSLFAQSVNAELDYRVFLTPTGNCHGLYVVQKSPTSFEVRELGRGRSNIAFDYRIVARRRGYEQVRLTDANEARQDSRE